MPVPTAITNLSTTPALNSPAGSESPTTTDEYFRAHASFIAELRDESQAQTYTAFTTAGTSTAYTLTPSPAIAALAAGQRFRVKFNAANGAAPTLAVSGLAATALKVYDSTGAKIAPPAGTLALNMLSDVEYDGTDWVVLDRVNLAASGANNDITALSAVPEGFLRATPFVYTAGATWTKPARLKFVRVKVQAGGGGGGGASTTNGAVGSGGAGGGYSEKIILAASLGATETVTVGAKGTGGAAGANGTAGGTSSFGAHCSATGGAFGVGGTTAANTDTSVGGTGTGGDINIAGQTGGGGAASLLGGAGGGSHFAAGAPMAFAAGIASATTAYGAGGGGAYRLAGVDAVGGNGAQGIVIVEEYF